MDTAALRELMVERHLRARGLRDRRVLAAIATVPREAFLPPALAEFAYDDRPLPIEAGQTISQPYIVALMIESLGLGPDEDVLEIGTGSGYAAAVLAAIARRVYTIERHAELADLARDRLSRLGFANVEVKHGDGTLGWGDRAPFHAIVVAAGGPDLPRPLLDQLAIGGRLVMPVGTSRAQELVRVTRISDAEYRREDLGPVVFVPLIGAAGWSDEPGPSPGRAAPRSVDPARPAGGARPVAVSKLIAECAAPLERIEDAEIDGLLERIGDARVVLLGEATHGTSEFYRMRTRITQQLILRHGFAGVAVEADWPDAAAVHRYVRGLPARPRRWVPFTRFPTWMWRNREVQALIEWLRAYNQEAHQDAGFYGLDLYSLYSSAHEVVRYLDRADPVAARAARERYGCLTPWQDDPAAYGRAALLGRMRACEDEVVAMLRELLARRIEDAADGDGDAWFDAAQNARVVADAERYYRVMYYGSAASWNLRDQHMFDTLTAILGHLGPGRDTRLVVWEHNSHVGDAAATEMAARGEHNVGQLCRAALGDTAYIVGFGTDHGTVAAADGWDEPMQRMRVRPARPDSYEALCHDAEIPAFLLPLRAPLRPELRDELAAPRLERAIGVVYRPATELESHYFQAVLPRQFDEYIWFDETSAVDALPPVGEPAVAPAEHPFAA
ncbi:MAG TPA: protein-L-isoaspartate(D-aspartate) O-methyltransferase [Kofleriaceae bacterium]|jgi:protein-L-isoaspartate(D-aspartate) O-methyltransferase|nr:protein-L-isoaspartate(D-aspartate) O-methyltransferase [Kofleriaceae bacterium]